MCYRYIIIEFVCRLRVPFQIPVREVLKMRYRYNVIQFVWSWSTYLLNLKKNSNTVFFQLYTEKGIIK